MTPAEHVLRQLRRAEGESLDEFVEPGMLGAIAVGAAAGFARKAQLTRRSKEMTATYDLQKDLDEYHRKREAAYKAGKTLADRRQSAAKLYREFEQRAIDKIMAHHRAQGDPLQQALKAVKRAKTVAFGTYPYPKK